VRLSNFLRLLASGKQS